MAAHHLVQDGALDVAAMVDRPERPLPLWPEKGLALRVARPPRAHCRCQARAARARSRPRPRDVAGDDLLRLVFTACHPVLPTEARVALTLRLVGGLATSEIARAFLVPEPTIAQRIVRAKRTLADARVPFEVPRAAERAERLESVLEVIYLVFNEGHLATAGARWTRLELCDDALRIARVLAGLAPDEPEVHGLVALLELSASRLAARIDRDGAPVLLADQDRAR